MFDNIGSKVKGLAVVIFFLGALGSLIWAITIWNSYNYYGSNFGIGLGCFVGGVLGSWIGSWVTYAIGEAAENSAKIAEQNDMIIKLLQGNQTGSLSMENLRTFSGNTQNSTNSVSAGAESQQDANPIAQSSANSVNADAKSLQGADLDAWSCPKCRHINPAGATFCQRCGKDR